MRFAPPRPNNDDEPILPLINVVFLLLIFFMLVGHLAATDPFHVEPPVSVSEDEPGPAENIVLIGVDGRVALDGVVFDDAALRIALTVLVAADGAAEFRVKTDGRASATRVIAVMELMRAAGVERLRLLTIPTER